AGAGRWLRPAGDTHRAGLTTETGGAVARPQQQGDKIMTFTIDSDNNITAFPTPDHAEAAIGAGAQAFTSQKDLAKLAAEWPISRLVETWNSFAGAPPFGDLKPV